MLSVFETLGEALRLYFKYFWVMVPVAIMMAGPDCFSSDFVPHKHLESQTETMAVIISLGVVISFMAYAMKDAIILGLLSQESASNWKWLTIWNCIRTYIRPLFLLQMLIMIIATLMSLAGGLVVFMLYRIFDSIQFWVFVLAAIYLIFIKYALAAPLVVVENLSPWKALQISWKMTKGNFVYVAGCYIVIFAAHGLLSAAVIMVFELSSRLMPFEQILININDYAFDPLWVVAAWCMYRRIKSLESLEVVETVSY